MMNGDSNHNIEGVGVGELPSAKQELEDQQTQQQQLGVTATNDQQQHEQQIKIESQEQHQQQHQDLPPADVDAAENSYQNQQQEDGTDASQSQQQQSTYTPLPTVVTQRPDSGCFLRCRGLPYSASENDVRKFFGEYTILDVSFTSSMDGKPTGECYVQFESREEASKAQLKDRQTMGTRYIEVFQVSDVEMGQLIKRMQMKKTLSTKGFVRIRGLPYSCGKADVQQFFRGLTVEEVIFGNTGPGLEGRPSGEGFVKFGTADEADSALQLNGQHMGSRYLEIFKSDGAAFEAFKTRSMNNIVPLKALAQSGDPWGSTGGYPPNAGGGGGYGGGGYSGGGQGGGGGYGYGYGGPGYGAYQNQAYEFGSGYEQHASSGRPMGRGRGGSYGHGGGGEDQHSNRYSPYPNYGYGGGEGRGAGGRGRGGGGRGRGGGGYGGGGGGHDNGGEYGDYGYGYGGGGYVGYNDSVVAPNKIYMRGLPFRISTNDIERFFAPLMCVDISLGTMPDGRSSGDGIVEFQNPTDARQALAKDRESIGNRYIELFPTQSAKIPSHVSYDSVGGKGGGGGGGGSGGGHRGAPIPTPAQQYAQAVQQQVAAYASGNYPTQHQYGQYGQSDYSNSYYGSYGSGSGGQDVGQQQPKTDYNWPASQF